MSAHSEEILYEAVHEREALHLGGRIEAPHLALALARWLMGHFGSIVRVLVRGLDHGRHHGPTSRRIAAPLVRDQPSRDRSLAFQQLPDEARGGTPIAPGLHEDVEHVAVLVDRPPQILLPPMDIDEQFVQIPHVANYKGAIESASADSLYCDFVDQFDLLGLGKDVPIMTGNESEGLLAPGDGKFLTFRVPYPMGFFAKGMDGPIDDPNTGWKGKAIWPSYSTRAPFHAEGGKETTSKLVKFQVRPTPLSK